MQKIQKGYCVLLISIFSYVLGVSPEHTESDNLKDNLNRFLEIKRLGSEQKDRFL